MTNETTASQPKSIGDDAQFLTLLREYNHVSEMIRGHAKREWAAFVAYIDSRAPAAQASANIQAAPNGYVIQAGDKELLEVASTVLAKYGYALASRHIAELHTRITLAATIQEPVMVAEPVEKAATKLCGRLLCLPQIRDGNNIYVTASAVNACVKEFLDKELAAPMVADPAGDLVKRLQQQVNDLCSLVEKYQAAATVKAVPSEALDLMKEARELAPILRGMSEGGGADRGDDIYAADYQAPDGDVFVIRAAELLADFASPLADKTGGGE